MQGQRKQYGIQHNVDGKIYYDMSDTLPSFATSLSMADNNNSMWDKGWLLVILPRTKLSKFTIFVGDIEITLYMHWFIYWKVEKIDTIYGIYIEDSYNQS